MTPQRGWAIALDVALYLVLPLVGLFVWGWDWRPIVLLYWLENITIGGVTFLTLVKQARAGDPGGMPAWFFFIHYGMFTFVHGVFVIVMIGLIPVITNTPAAPFDPLWIVGAWLLATLVQWVLALRANPPLQAGIGRAYGRVIVLHLTILGAVWLIAAFGLPAIVAVFLVVLHAVIDVTGLVAKSIGSGGRKPAHRPAAVVAESHTDVGAATRRASGQ